MRLLRTSCPPPTTTTTTTVKMDEMGSLWERQRDKSMKDVRIHSQLWRTFITEQAGPVIVFSLHGPIYRTRVSKQSALSPVKKGTLGESPPPPPPLLPLRPHSYLPAPASPRLIPAAARRERPGRKGRNRVCHQQLKRVAWQQD